MQTIQSWIRLSVLTLCVVFVLGGCGKSDVEKAQEFIAAGMYPQAMELLNKRITENPKDAKAHFLLGSSYIYTGNLSGADERFASAVRLKTDYGFKIGTEYKKAGSEAIINGDIDKAQRLFGQAVRYQANLRMKISEELFTEGQGLFEQGQRDQADSRFLIAHQLNPCKGAAIAALYFKASQQAKTTPEAVNDLKTANRFSNKYSAELRSKQEQLEKERLLQLVKKTEKKFGKAKYIRVEKAGEWKKGCTIRNKARIIYFATNKFKKRDNIDGIGTWKAATSKETWVDKYGNGEISIEFSMQNKPADIYFWVEKL